MPCRVAAPGGTDEEPAKTHEPATTSVTADHPADPSDGRPLAEPGLGSRPHVNARVVQIALGLVWILDGALQFPPSLFGKGFVTNVILPSAQDQPAPISWAITNVAHFMLPDIGVWNFLFATLQLAIGVGLLFRRTLKPALALMIVWSLCVWFFGEGFGMLLTGTASPLMGAPGAVLLYAGIGVLVWPRDEATGSKAPGERARPVGGASSAGASGPFGSRAALATWAVLWVGYAVLGLLPANRAAGSLSSAISEMASGEPSWYAHFLTAFSGHFSGISPQTAWLLAIASLVIGLGPLGSGRPTKAEGPMPYGCLVQWHAHTNLCTSLTTHPISGFTPCQPGAVNERTPVMTHVWQVPVAGGPLALDPSGLQVVEAAYEAQLSGQAPITPAAGSTFASTKVSDGSF